MRSTAATAVVALAAALAVPAAATTGVDVVTPVRVTLRDGGVVFSHRLHLTTASTLAVRVVNKSSKRRSFAFGYRRSRVLQRGGTQLFYFTPYAAGRVAWRSVGAGAKTFRGTFRVKYVVSAP